MALPVLLRSGWGHVNCFGQGIVKRNDLCHWWFYLLVCLPPLRQPAMFEGQLLSQSERFPEREAMKLIPRQFTMDWRLRRNKFLSLEAANIGTFYVVLAWPGHLFSSVSILTGFHPENKTKQKNKILLSSKIIHQKKLCMGGIQGAGDVSSNHWSLLHY